MSPEAFFWTIAVLTVFIVGLSKSGLVISLGLLGVPLLTLVMSPRDAAGMMLPLLLCMDAVAIWNYRRDADWRLLAILLPGAMVGTVAGWLLWTAVNDAVVTLCVGLVSLASVVYFLLPRPAPAEDARPSRAWGSFWGAIAGLTSFISHTGGPPFQIYVIPQKLPPVRYAGTNAWFFAIVNAVKLVPYYFLGQLSPTNLQHGLFLAPVAIAGVVIGTLLVRRIPTKVFYTITYWLIFLLSLKLIYDGTAGVFFFRGAAA